MKYLLTILFLIGVAQAQPGGYTEGTLVNWNYLSTDQGYFRPVGWDASVDDILVWFDGDGTSGASLNSQTVGLQLADAGINWNGSRTAGGITRKVLVLIIYEFAGNYIPDYMDRVEYFFTNHSPSLASVPKSRRHIGGLSGGPGRAIGYLTGQMGTNGASRSTFGKGIWLSCSDVDAMAATITTDSNYVWFGTDDANAGTPPSESYQLYNALPGTAGVTRFIDSTVGGTHSETTWGDAMDIAGDPNLWEWLIWTGVEGLDSTVQKIPILNEDVVDLSTASGRIADSVIRKFDGNSDPYWSDIDPTDDDINTQGTSALDVYGGYNKSRIIDIWFKKRYKNFKIYVLIPNQDGTDSVEFFLRDSFRVFKAGVNGYDWVSYYNRDTAAAEYQPDARFVHTPFLTPGYYLVEEFADTVQGITICETMSAVVQSAVNRYYFYGTEVDNGETTWTKLNDADIAAIDTAQRPMFTAGTNFQQFAKRESQTHVDWMRDFQVLGTTLLVRQGPGEDSMIINSSNIDYLLDRKAGNPGAMLYPAWNGGQWGDGIRPVNDSTGLAASNILMRGNRKEHYTTFAHQMAVLYATYGNDATDRDNLFTGGAEQYGLGIYDAWDYNEPNGSFNPNFFQLPIQLASMVIAVADSIKSVDASQIIMMPAMAGADVEHSRPTARLLCFYYGESVFDKIDMIALHAYHVSIRQPYDATLAERIFTSKTVGPLAVDADIVGDRTYMQEYLRYRRQMAQEYGRFLPISINEFGSDKQDGDVFYVHGPSTDGQYDTSLYNIKPYDGYNRFKSHGIYAMQAAITAFEVGIDNMAYYWHQDVDTVTYMYSYLNSGMSRPEFINRNFASFEFPDSVKLYASHFMYYGLAERLNGWRPKLNGMIDTTAGARHLWTWEKPGTDSLAQIMFYGGHDDGTASYTTTGVQDGAVFWVPKQTDSVNLFGAFDQSGGWSVIGTTSAATVTNNEVSWSADALPKILFYLSSVAAPPNIRSRYRFKN